MNKDAIKIADTPHKGRARHSSSATGVALKNCIWYYIICNDSAEIS